SDELERELIGWSRTHLGPSVAPRSIVHRQDLPHTRSGKIMRRLLKARELGLPEGDLSSLDQKEEDVHD
ncbi:MAG: AMP-binding enzyme, partial [Acidimicrobiia bacterium]